MCLAPEPNSFIYRADNWGANPSTTLGVSVTPGASNAEGSWTASGLGALAEEVCQLHVQVSGGNTTANQKDHLLDIGIDPAGGTSYTALISNIICGQSAAIAGGYGSQFTFPIRIPKNATIGFRIQGNNATAGTVRVSCVVLGRPTRPELVWAGNFSETIGTITGSGGVSFTPGNAADGTWVSLGTTSKALKHVQVAAQCSNGTITAQYTYVELALGNSGTLVILNKQFLAFTGTAETMTTPNGANLLSGHWAIPAGATLYVRGRCNGAPASGYNAVAIGIG